MPPANCQRLRYSILGRHFVESETVYEYEDDDEIRDQTHYDKSLSRSLEVGRSASIEDKKTHSCRASDQQVQYHEIGLKPLSARFPPQGGQIHCQNNDLQDQHCQ